MNESKIQKEQSDTNSIFLIEEAWIDPMENRNADGYEPFGYKLTEQKAKEFCELNGYWTDDDCWSIQYKPNGRMWKYRYKKIPLIPDEQPLNKREEAQMLIKQLAYEFIDDKWDKINPDLYKIEYTKEEFLQLIEDQIDMAAWVISEIAPCGMDKKYLEDYIVSHEEDGALIWKIQGKYIRMIMDGDEDDNVYNVKCVEPKQKTITYYE